MAVAIQTPGKPAGAGRSQVLRMQNGRVKKSEFDLRIVGEAWPQRRLEGKALRAKVPREAHAKWAAPRNRPSPLELIAASNVGRQEKYIPLRMGRMAASPFAFLRGSAVVMAWDLAHSPSTNINLV